MKKDDNGFTLIEIALVLAIAGAIFAAVFIALRGVWADERDSERRDDMMTFIRQLKNYQTNNARGALPTGSLPLSVDGEEISADRVNKTKYSDDTSWQVFYRDYFKDSFTDPDGVLYNLNIRECKLDKNGQTVGIEKSCELDVTGDYTIDVIIGASCYGEDAVRSANSRNVAVMYDMEAGGYYCENT